MHLGGECINSNKKSLSVVKTFPPLGSIHFLCLMKTQIQVSAMLCLINFQRVQQHFDYNRSKYIFVLEPVTYLSVVTAIR